MSPYRIPSPRPARDAREVACPDRDIAPVFLAAWLGSIVRVALAVARHETFATEATVAVLAEVLTLSLRRAPPSLRHLDAPRGSLAGP
jgi:hypothetical protein